MSTRKLNYTDAFRQLKKDLIGKDSYRGITLTYAWLANQFGHFCLGALPTLILILTDNKTQNHYNIALIWAFKVTLFWFCFELYNFLGPLLFKIRQVNKKGYLNSYTFQPNWKNIAYDTFVDVCFFALGAMTICLLFNTDAILFVLILGLTICLLFFSVDWFFIKMHQQYANYPFQFRLSQWKYQIDAADKEKIVTFMKSKKNENHLLIHGSKFSGKTSLGVAICNELSIQKRKCLYTTGIKIYSDFFEYLNINKVATEKIWSWKEVDFLIIDDINPGLPFNHEIVKAEEFALYLNGSIESPTLENKNIIQNKNVIWILGNCHNTSSPKEWMDMLCSLGIEKLKIQTICLP